MSRAALETLDRLPPPVADLDPVRRLRAAHQVFVDSAHHPRAPPLRHRQGRRREPGSVAVHEEVVDANPVLHAAAVRQGPARRRAAAAARAGRRAAVRALRDPAARHGRARCCPTTTSTSPTGTTPATCRSQHGRFGFDEYVDHVDATSSRCSGPAPHVMAVCQPCVPVLAAVAVMAEDGNPAQPRSMTLMAGPDRHAREPHPVNDLATEQADRVVRAEPDHHGAAALPGAGGASTRLPAARRVHGDEPRAPRASAHLELYQAPGRRRRRPGRDHPRRSTTSTSPCWTCPPSSTSRRCSRCSRSTRWPAGELEYRGRPVDPRRDPPHRAADRRGRARRHLRARPDAWPRTSCAPALGRTRKRHHLQAGVGPLRRVQRAALGGARSTRWCAASSRRTVRAARSLVAIARRTVIVDAARGVDERRLHLVAVSSASRYPSTGLRAASSAPSGLGSPRSPAERDDGELDGPLRVPGRRQPLPSCSQAQRGLRRPRCARR